MLNKKTRIIFFSFVLPNSFTVLLVYDLITMCTNDRDEINLEKKTFKKKLAFFGFYW